MKKFFSAPAALKFELLFYPVLLLYRMPFAWMRSLWAARILLNGRWSNYMGYHPHNSINSLFYRTQWINLDRYGRSQHSPILGLGDYPLRSWVHISLPASYIYAHAGAVTTLACTIVWIFSHLVWIDSIRPWWVILVTLVMFLSTTGYAMAFARQNYQMLGWMWLPSALYFTVQGDLVVAGLAWFAAGISGLTPVFFAVPIVFILALMGGNSQLMFVLAPVLTFAVFRVLTLLFNREAGQSLIRIAKIIGLTQKNVRYDRGMKSIGLTTLYFTGLYFVSALLMSYAQGVIAVLPLLAIGLFLVNQRFLRLADEQSLIVITASLFAFASIQAEPNWLTLLALWLAVNPIAVTLSIQKFSKCYIDRNILVNPPFDHTALMAGIESFLNEIKPGERVYFAFNDPNGKYKNIFDGYRVIHELPLQIASKNAFHLFPDWWAVAETNYEGAPQCWGRSFDNVIGNCRRWDAHYAIIYQATGEHLDSQWKSQFSLISEFDWGDYLHLLRGVDLWPPDRPTPKWFLMRLNR